jgi:hypothetical protein
MFLGAERERQRVREGERHIDVDGGQVLQRKFIFNLVSTSVFEG